MDVALQFLGSSKAAYSCAGALRTAVALKKQRHPLWDAVVDGSSHDTSGHDDTGASVRLTELDTSMASHFELGFDFYTHFTSPIRRYPDLMTHRLLKEAIQCVRPGAVVVSRQLPVSHTRVWVCV